MPTKDSISDVALCVLGKNLVNFRGRGDGKKFWRRLFMGSIVKAGIIVGVLMAVLFSTALATEESDQTLFENGVTRLQNGDFQAAVDLFTEVIMKSPTHAKSYKNRGVALMRLEQYDLAINDFSKALDLDPGLIGIYSNLGAAWHYKKDYTKAVDSYDKEIALRPGEYITYFNRALSRMELHQYGPALSDLETALKMKPDLQWAITLKNQIINTVGFQIDSKKESQKISDTVETQKAETQKTPAAVKQDQEPSKTVTAATEPENKDGSLDGQQWPYAVQTGAYTDLESAERMKNRLVQKGYEAWVLELKGANDKTWFLVRTGRHLGYSKAILLIEKLKRELDISGVVCTMGKF
ncbi:MAG: tetratricopeptide repeat protein [Pseudomonadota bacterium]